MVLTGAALASEASALSLDQARASAAWWHHRHEFSSYPEAATYFPPVSDGMKARAPDEGDGSGSRMIDPMGFSTPVLESGEVSPLLELGVPSDQVQPLALGLAIQNNVRIAECGERSTWNEGADTGAHSDTNICMNDRYKPRLDVLVPGDVAETLRLSMPTLDYNRAHGSVSGYGIGSARTSLNALEETMVVQSVPSGSANGMPSGVAGITLPSVESYEAGVPVSYEIGDAPAIAGSVIPFGVQATTGTGSEIASDADVIGRAGDFSLDASATPGFETNPFLIDLPDTGTASLRLNLLPTFSRQGARGDVRVSTRIEYIEYTANYDAVLNAGADFSSRLVLNERLEGNVELSIDSGVLATNFAGLEPVDGVPGNPGALPGGDDITLLGLDQRRTEYQAGGGLRYQLSPRDELAVSMSFRADRFEEQDLDDLQETDFLTGRVSYARQVSSGLEIGVAVDASSIDIVDQSLGAISTISPQAIVSLALSPIWELAGSLGVASIRSDTNFSEETFTAFSGDVSICRSGVRANLCLTGARQVVPFGIGGAGLQSTVGATYSFRLSERETLSLSANYGKASGAFLAEGGGIETISGFVSYRLQLAERVRLSADARYTDLRADLTPNVSNFQALIGLTVSTGRAR